MKTRSAHSILHTIASGIIWKNLLSVRPSQCHLSGNDKNGKVGEVILQLCPAEREELKKLTSDDVNNIRLY